jgi:hypothetical protein
MFVRCVFCSELSEQGALEHICRTGLLKVTENQEELKFDGLRQLLVCADDVYSLRANTGYFNWW